MRITRLQNFILRLIGSRIDEAQSATFAAAETTDLSDASGNMVPISGSAINIKGFGTIQAGARFVLRFTGVNTIVSVDVDATSKITIPSNTNITTANGDLVTIRSEGSGNWLVEAIQPIATRIGVNRTTAGNYNNNPAPLTGDTNSHMLGLSFALDIPLVTTTYLVTITGVISIDNTGTTLIEIGARQDVTTMPIAGDADTGNSLGAAIAVGSALADMKQPFSITGTMEVAAGETAWIDLVATLQSGTDTVSFQDIGVTVIQAS